MSRGNGRARRRARSASGARSAATGTSARSTANDRLGPAEEHAARVESARRRARVAKAVLGATGAAVFAGAMMLARTSYPGHAKAPTQPLGAPPKFVKIVRRNLLQAGIVAPAQAPPGASTSVS